MTQTQRLDDALLDLSISTSLSGVKGTVANIRYTDGSTQAKGAIPDMFVGRIASAVPHQTFAIGDKDGQAHTPFFRFDGLKFYFVGNNTNEIYEYDMSVAWDISTAVFNQNLSIGAVEPAPTGLSFSRDGTSMFLLGDNSNAVNQYDLSTAWDISTALFVSAFDISSQDLSAWSVPFRPDGLAFYFAGDDSNEIFRYNLTIPWDISTASYSGDSFSISAQTSLTNGVGFRADGALMYVIANGDFGGETAILEYFLSTPWDITTAVFTEALIIAQAGIFGPIISEYSDKLYFISPVTDLLYEYNLGLRVGQYGSITGDALGIGIDAAADAFLRSDTGAVTLFTNAPARVVASFRADDSQAVLELENDATANSALSKIFVSDRTPVGNVTAKRADIGISADATTPDLFFHIELGPNNTGWRKIFRDDTSTANLKAPVDGNARFHISKSDNQPAFHFDYDDLNDFIEVKLGINNILNFTFENTVATTAVITYDNSAAVNGASVDMFIGSAAPNNNISGSQGDFYVRKDGEDSSIYAKVLTGAIGWINVTANSILGFGCKVMDQTDTTKRYLFPGASIADAPTTPVEFVVPRDGHIKTMSVYQMSPASDGGNNTYAVIVNDVVSVINVIIASTAKGPVIQTQTNPFFVFAGARLSIEVSRNQIGTTSPSDVTVALEYI